MSYKPILSLTISLLISLTLANEPEYSLVKCFWYEGKNMTVFDLIGLTRPRKQREDFSFTSTQGTDILYNFCSDTLYTCRNETSGVEQTAMIIARRVVNGQEQCVLMTGHHNESSHWSLLDSSNHSRGIKINLNPGQHCDNTSLYQISLELECDEHMNEKQILFTNTEQFDENICHNTLKGYSREACPKFNYYPIWSFFIDHRVFFGVIMIALGFVATFLGLKLLIMSIFALGVLTTTTLLMVLLFYAILPHGADHTAVWIVISFGFVLGLFLGFVMTKVRPVFYIILGSYFGYVIGLVIYNLVIIRIAWALTKLYWLTIIASIILGASFSYYFMKHLVILATAFCGSYGIVRGYSLFAEGFPNISLIIDLIDRDETDTLDSILTPWVYIYLLFFVIFLFLGLIFQYKINHDKFSQETKDERLSGNEDYYKEIKI